MKWGPLVDRYCRIDRSLAKLNVYCLGNGKGLFAKGTVTVDGTKIHLAWGTMMLRMVIDGALLTSSNFTGNAGLKLSGIEFDDPEMSLAKKLTLSGAPLDKPGKSALLTYLLDEMRDGAVSEPHADKTENVQFPMPKELGELGKVQTVVYLGEFAKPVGIVPGGGPRNIINLSVYDVEFANGERLCGLHQQEGGMLDAFMCA